MLFMSRWGEFIHILFSNTDITLSDFIFKISTWNGLSKSQIHRLLSWYEFCTMFPRILTVNFPYSSLRNNLQKLEALMKLNEREKNFWMETTTLFLQSSNEQNITEETVHSDPEKANSFNYIDAKTDIFTEEFKEDDINSEPDDDPLSLVAFARDFRKFIALESSASSFIFILYCICLVVFQQ